MLVPPCFFNLNRSAPSSHVASKELEAPVAYPSAKCYRKCRYCALFTFFEGHRLDKNLFWLVVAGNKNEFASLSEEKYTWYSYAGHKNTKHPSQQRF